MASEQPPQSPAQVSWQTRMQSVLRQFHKLVQAPVYDKTQDQMVNVVGLVCLTGAATIQVAPTDGGPIYSVQCEELDL